MKVSVQGFEWFLYNRTAAYDHIISQMQAKATPCAEPTEPLRAFSRTSGAEGKAFYPHVHSNIDTWFKGLDSTLLRHWQISKLLPSSMLRWPGLNVRHPIWIRMTFYLSHLSSLRLPSPAVIHRHLVCWSLSAIEQKALSALSRCACFSLICV
jgi:hypothetical protein